MDLPEDGVEGSEDAAGRAWVTDEVTVDSPWCPGPAFERRGRLWALDAGHPAALRWLHTADYRAYLAPAAASGTRRAVGRASVDTYACGTISIDGATVTLVGDPGRFDDLFGYAGEGIWTASAFTEVLIPALSRSWGGLTLGEIDAHTPGDAAGPRP